MSKIDKLTEEQIIKLDYYKELYVDKFFKSKKEADFDEVREYTNWLYKFCNLKEPITILVNSPYEILIAYQYLKVLLPNINKMMNQVEDQVWDQVENQVWNQVRNQVRNQVEDQVWDQVRNQVVNQVVNQVRNQVWDQVVNQVVNQVRNQVRNQVVNQVENQVEDQVWDQVRNQVENQKLEWLDISYYFSSFNSWISFIDYFNNEILDLKNKKVFNEFKKLLDLNIFWSITLENVCIISKNAVDYQRNSNFQLHSTDKASIVFPGDEFQYKLYYVQGVGVSEELFNRLSNKEYTFEDWSKEENEEIKSVVLAFYEEKFGGQFVFDFLSSHLKEINTYVDKKNKQYLKGTVSSMNIGVYTLFKGNINNIDIAYVRCYCPSTDRMFMLGVHPSFIDAKSAISSLCQIPIKLKPYLKTIARQGEIYSFNFDEVGTTMLKEEKLTKEDFQNVVSLTSEEYFGNLKFEY